jgi:nitrous oxidase accessory protein NosD
MNALDTKTAFLAPLALLAALAAVALVLGADALGGSKAGVRHVGPGQSIQTAIDAAAPGDTIDVAAGTYRENLTITKDGITLRGAGATSAGTVLAPPSKPAGRVCDFEGMNGICITGVFTPNSSEIGRPVRDVTVTGIAVRGFPRFGILVNNAVDATIAGNEVAHSGAYGVVGFFLKDARFRGNVSHDNGQGGFYLADSPQADVVLVGNRSYRNATSEGFGIFLRDISHGVVRGNTLEGNCVGLMLLGVQATRSASDWVVQGNTVRGNTAACPASEDIPTALSGLGIGLLGVDHAVVEGNVVSGNRPSGDTPVAGGIAVASSKSFGGLDAAAVVVRGNRLEGNAPADLVYDGQGAGNRFAGNRCASSMPAGLCG